MLKLPLYFLLVFAAPSALSAEPSAADVQADKLKKVIVVAELSAGEYLPQNPQCSQPEILCMDPPPFWLTARIISTVFGKLEASELRVTASSHFGMSRYEHMQGPKLVLIRTDGIRSFMPRHAEKPLVRDKHGALYLRTFAKPTISWLPCGIADLREEIFPVDFNEKGLVLPEDEFSNYGVTANPSMYRMTRKGAWPRYAISVDRLRAYLEKAGPDIALECNPQ